MRVTGGLLMDALTRRNVRQRANGHCEYCRSAEEDSLTGSFHVEHVVPIKHGGGDSEDNLALSCRACNLRKGSNLTGIDPTTGRIVVLYNPRVQTWDEHFEWNEIQIVGLTDVGRTTIRVLDLNSADRLTTRLSETE